jgi:hypothetical protein
MRRFDPQERRRLLLDSCGYDRSLRDPFEEAVAGRWLASVASANTTTAVYAILVGFFDPARRLLEKAQRWVTEAIERNERPNHYSQYGDEALRSHTLAWCNFLLSGKEDSESYRQFVEFEGQYLADPYVGNDRISVSLVLPHYVSGHAYERALEVFAACPKLQPADDLNKIRGEAQMCYVIARQRLGLEYSAEEVQEALAKFLKRHVDSSWLAKGHSLRAAEWMKIAHWREGADPFATVLKAYDYLPDVLPPQEVVEYRSAHPLS